MDEQNRRQFLRACVAGSVAGIAGCSAIDAPRVGTGSDGGENVDDWQFDPDDMQGDSGSNQSMSGASTTVQTEAADDAIGLSAGGAADVGTFRRNVFEGNLPLPESMSYEGLFHEYYFDTGGDGSCGSWFCPTYTPAISDDPLSGETERFLSVGLDSGLSQSEFERPALNLVLVLDISGSMSSEFDDYYYDQFGNKQQIEEGTERTKIDIARDALADLTEQLRPEDRLGVVLFNGNSHVAKPMRRVETTDMDAIRGHIREDIVAEGSTNMSAGMDAAAELLREVTADDRETRMITLTDAQINTGETGSDSLQSTLESRADSGIHSTFVGVGVDFNADLVDQITAVRGSNYYSVHSATQFEQRMVEEFEYMVTPLVYDLSLKLDAEGYDIEQVYGSTAAEAATGELMQVNTLFPSDSEGRKAKGGVVLVELDKVASGETDLTLEASWERRDGHEETARKQISVPEGDTHWGSDAVRKAVLLAREAALLKSWTIDERDKIDAEPTEGIDPPAVDLSKWELQSQPLTVSAENAARIETFREHLASELEAVGDDTLEQELELLDAILDARGEN